MFLHIYYKYNEEINKTQNEIFDQIFYYYFFINCIKKIKKIFIAIIQKWLNHNICVECALSIASTIYIFIRKWFISRISQLLRGNLSKIKARFAANYSLKASSFHLYNNRTNQVNICKKKSFLFSYTCSAVKALYNCAG